MEENNKKQIKISLITLLKIVFLLIVFILLICNIVYWRKYNENKEVSKKEVKNEEKNEVNNEGNNEGNKWQWTSESYKPIIYIYPEQETLVSVKLDNPENLICTYPEYNNDGWTVYAKPNGDLQDIKTGRNLYALYWEGKSSKIYNYENAQEGFIVKGENTAEFLEEKLEILGLNEREAEEFIVYWLPQMEKNEYNYIRFETKEEINKEMPLEIEPNPDTIIRILMDWKALDEKIEIEEQKLEKANREGFTVVEWGGSILNESIIK